MNESSALLVIGQAVMRAGTHFNFHARVHNESQAYQMGQMTK